MDCVEEASAERKLVLQASVPKLKVLHLFKTFFPDTYGGIEQVVRTLAEHSAAIGVDCRVLVLSTSDRGSVDMPEGYRLIRCKQNFALASTGFSLEFLHRLKVEAQWADLIHVHYPWPFADLACLLTGTKKPMVMTYHSDVVNQPTLDYLYAPLRRWFLGRQSRIVATSPNYAHSSNVLRRLHHKVSVIPIGAVLPTPPPTESSIQQWKQKFGSKYFVFIGVPRYYKGLHFLLEALKDTNYPLVLIGDGGDRQALEEQASTLGLTETHFVGAVSDADKNALLAGAHCLVLPSHKRSEAYGIVLAEASAYGVPMITCDIGTGTTFVNLNEITGLTVAPADPVALATALSRMWTDEHSHANWSANARERFNSELLASTMAKRYAELYRTALIRSGCAP